MKRKNINVDDLVVFLSNPAEYVLKKRLGVKLDINISEIKDEEDFSPDNIATYNIKSSIQELRLRNFDKERIFKFLAKSGNLPQASLARGFYEKNYLSVESLLRKIDISGHKIQEAVSRTIGDINISAKYTLYGERQIFFRVGKLRPKDILKAWIYHLIVSTVKDNVSTSFVAEDKSISFKGNEFDEKKSAFDIIKDLWIFI
jgi:exodeoxyribonuclease V gamma subunit